MGLNISFDKCYKLRSGNLLNLQDVGAYYWHGQDMSLRKCAYFLTSYAAAKLKRPDGTKPENAEDYYGEFVVPMKNVQDIISRCNKALQYEYAKNKEPLKKIFNIDGWTLRYDGYDQYFFEDVREVAAKLSVILEDLGNPDVVVIMNIG